MYSKILLLDRQWKKSISCHHVSFWLTADSRRQAKVHSPKYGDVLISMSVCVWECTCCSTFIYPLVSHPLLLSLSPFMEFYCAGICATVCVDLHVVILQRHFSSVALTVEVSHWLTDVRKHSCVENRKYERKENVWLINYDSLTSCLIF